ncbi:lipoprotein [Aquabacterium sp.]|uniref:LPS translocon maturation chaperone LptM n=1 Tax=Aquabacterium sp. TaxID=1872578 RepID=UPI0035B4516F
MNKIIRILGSIAKPQRFHRHSAAIWAGVAAAGLLLSGCGQKGPLYLPSPSKAASSTSDSK